MVRSQLSDDRCLMLYYLIILYLLILPFGQLLRIPTPYPDITIHATDIIIGILFLTWLFGIFNSKLQHDRSTALPRLVTPIHKPLGIFTLIALFTLLKDVINTPINETLAATLYLFRWAAYASLFPIILTLRRFKTSANLKSYLTITFALITLFGFLQYFIFPDLRPLEIYGWDDHYYRLTANFLDPGFTGIILLIGLIYIFQFFDKAMGQLNNKTVNFYLFLFISVYIAITLTYSRATYLSLFIVALIYSYFKKSWKFLATSLAIFSITWLILPRPPGAGGDLDRVSTIKYRLINYQQTLQIIKDHPFLGIGFNRMRYAKREYQFVTLDEWQTSHSAAGGDNSLLFVFATTGLVGGTAYLWLWFIMLKSTYPKSLQSKTTMEQWGNGAMTFITLMAILVHSNFHNTLFYPPVMALIWILLGLSFSKHKA